GEEDDRKRQDRQEQGQREFQRRLDRQIAACRHRAVLNHSRRGGPLAAAVWLGGGQGQQIGRGGVVVRVDGQSSLLPAEFRGDPSPAWLSRRLGRRGAGWSESRAGP